MVHPLFQSDHTYDEVQMIQQTRDSLVSDVDVAIFAFDHDHGVPARDLPGLLGGKGAGLAEMTKALGMSVPPGFTIPLTVCRTYRETGWPDELEPLLAHHITDLGERMGRRFGDTADPLLVAVRSGAPISMPGMLDTVLNLGLNDETVHGLAAVSSDPIFAWDSYRRFIHMFAITVMGIAPEQLPECEDFESIDALQEHVSAAKRAIREVAGEDIPADPHEQLRRAVCAVFESWESPRAKAYRAKEGIDEQMGTAVNVQAMVFGNRGDNSGTGVVFTRNPSTGENRPYGDYLPKAQGEDVVAGTAHTLQIDELSTVAPEAYAQLETALRRLEVHYRDMCDVEFTIESGRLWLLQTRAGKRTATAAVKIAVDLAGDTEVRLTPEEAAERVPEELRIRARQEVLAQASHRKDGDGPLTVGLGASPGRVSGKIVLNSEAAADADCDVILVRPQTSPEDVAGMASSVGILTTTGGLVSHAAVVARGWHLPAVVGAREVAIQGDIVTVGAHTLRAGDVITIDGSTGEVWIGELAKLDVDHDADAYVNERLPELQIIESWSAAAGG
jgi:pyruvate,orthophosphate dikinase